MHATRGHTLLLVGLLAFLAGTVAAAAPAAGPDAPAGTGPYAVTGMGGAGGMFTPTVSPEDPKLMFLSCDMSGVYRSTDGGAHWQLIHHRQLHSALRARPAFAGGAVYWADGDGLLRASRDKGLTWPAVTDGPPPWQGGIRHIAAVEGGAGAGAGTVLLVGTDKGLWVSKDAGKSWSAAADTACDALLSLGATAYAAVRAADGKDAKGEKGEKGEEGKKGSRLLRADFAKGGDWQPVALPQAAGHAITSLTGSGPKAGPQRETLPVTLFATIDAVGIVRSPDGGGRWDVVMPWQKQNDILMPPHQTQVVYAAQDNGQEVFRTADGGKTWTSIFHMTGPRKNVELAWVQTILHWSYSIMSLGLGIDPANPRTVLVSTQGDFYRSTDGGTSWQQLMNEPVGAAEGDDGGSSYRYRSTGLEVTSVWDYVFDPAEYDRQYICYTDIGFARSLDGGATWISATRGCPWGNTYYQIAFDPAVKGRIYAACSNRHDIPHWTHIDKNGPRHAGGVCVSDNYGASWRVLAPALPKLPCTSLVIDPKSPAGKLTMYAAFFEGGVYKSTDGGTTWAKKSQGLGNPGNLHAYRIRIQPASGNLYCLITAFRDGRDFNVPGGVWRSTDGAETWTDVTASAKLVWPTDFAVGPADENTMYVAAATSPGKAQGGLWKTADGGKTWKHILTDADLAKWCPPGYTHGMMVKLHPQHADWVYFGSGSHGLWLSRDAGSTWRVFEKLPFRSVQNITFDPKDPAAIRVSTFGGGVWKGPAVPE